MSETNDSPTSDRKEPVDDPVDPAEISDADVVDSLPADLDLEAFETDYVLPNNNRRRIPAALYLLMAAAVAFAWFSWRDSSPLLNNGVAIAAALLAGFGVYGFIAGRELKVDETQALASATKTVGFPVGHASAAMVWRGVWSTPVWRLLVYSAENPPTQRALVLVSGITGEVIEWFAEDNPEDWMKSSSPQDAAAEPGVDEAS